MMQSYGFVTTYLFLYGIVWLVVLADLVLLGMYLWTKVRGARKEAHTA